jgi:hypothetical protein
MKDGGIVEMGTHTELMQIKGEYAKLHNIQASAFQDPVRVEVMSLFFSNEAFAEIQRQEDGVMSFLFVLVARRIVFRLQQWSNYTLKRTNF